MEETEKLMHTVKDLVPVEVYKNLDKIVKRDITVLGTGEVFTLRDSQGEIKAFRSTLTLSADKGELIQPGYNKPWVISAQGYEKWQEAAGASVIFPKTVVVNGEVSGNPHVDRDKKGNIVSVTARAVAFRFSDKGLPVASDWTTILDLNQYKMIDLLAKAKKFPQAFKLLPIDMNVDESVDGTWTAYYFDESTRLWVNTAHKEAMGWYSQIWNRSKKAVDYAQTFCKRNATKHLSGLQKAPGPNWQIPVICWRPTGNNLVKWDATQYSQLQDKVDSLADDGNVQVDAGVETAITEDEELEAHEAVIDIEDHPEDQNGQVSPPESPGEPVSEPPPVESSEPVSPGSPLQDDAPAPDPNTVLKNNLMGVYENFPEEFGKVCDQMNINPESIKTINPHELSPRLGQEVLKKVSQLIDEQSARG
jgi:hypothetical protein